MQYSIEKKLVVAVSSSALFDLTESDRVFRERGARAYRQFQEKHLDRILDKGVAFPFIRRFLNINRQFPQEQPVEVVLLSRNSPTTGRRVFRSIRHYEMDISRAAFVTGKSPYPYIPAFNASLFLSANNLDVQRAIRAGYPAGTVLPSTVFDDLQDSELRIAFDFDGVIVDDESEAVYTNSDLPNFHKYELEKSNVPHNPGLLAELFTKLSFLQKLEGKAEEENPHYNRTLKTAIVTARNAPAHERFVTTLETWGVSADQTFFLGGMSKDRILKVLKPHIFFDDQKDHLKSSAGDIPMVHIPFGIANRKTETERDMPANGF